MIGTGTERWRVTPTDSPGLTEAVTGIVTCVVAVARTASEAAVMTFDVGHPQVEGATVTCMDEIETEEETGTRVSPAGPTSTIFVAQTEEATGCRMIDPSEVAAGEDEMIVWTAAEAEGETDSREATSGVKRYREEAVGMTLGEALLPFAPSDHERKRKNDHRLQMTAGLKLQAESDKQQQSSTKTTACYNHVSDFCVNCAASEENMIILLYCLLLI